MKETHGLALAFLFGCGYNWILSRSVNGERRGEYRDDGLTAFWVIGGVLATLLIASLVRVSLPRLVFYWHGEALALTNQQHAVIYLLKFFAASGLPMTVGALWRHLNQGSV